MIKQLPSLKTLPFIPVCAALITDNTWLLWQPEPPPKQVAQRCGDWSVRADVCRHRNVSVRGNEQAMKLTALGRRGGSERLDCAGRSARTEKTNPYVALNNHWSCDSGTWGGKSWRRSSTPLAFSRRAEAGNNLTIIMGYKPCHAAIRANSRQPITDVVDGRYKHSAVVRRGICFGFE